MARSRNIKPALFNNEILGVSDPLYTLLFQALWLIADRDGRLEDRPLRIKVEAFPYRENINVDAMLGWLAEKEFIIRYVYGENRYIQVVNFSKHQNPHKNEKESIIPKFNNDLEQVPIKSEQVPIKSEAVGLIPDSFNMIPDSFNSQNAKEEKKETKESNLYIAPTRRTFEMFAEWQPEPKSWAAYLKMSSHVVKPEQFTKYTLLEFIRSNVGKGEKMESEWQKFYVNAIARGYIKPEGQEAKPTYQPKQSLPAIDEANKPYDMSNEIVLEKMPVVSKEEKERQRAIIQKMLAGEE
jgi:hypothetical protein